MRILALDTSGPAASAAVFEGRLLSEAYLESGLKHSATIMRLIDNALNSSDTGTKDIGLVAVSAGPGSFTGLRIGMAVAKGLSQTLGVPCAAVGTLRALAMNAEGFTGCVCPVMDARRREVYCGIYEDGLPVIGDSAMPLGEYLEKVIGRDKPALFLGDGVRAYGQDILDGIKGARFAAPHLMLQRAGGVAAAASAMKEDEYGDAFSLLPDYFRLPQAERARLESMK